MTLETPSPPPDTSGPQVPLLVTPLSDICIDVVAANFESRPYLKGLPEKYLDRILDKLPLDLPLELAGLCHAFLSNANKDVHPVGSCWKFIAPFRAVLDLIGVPIAEGDECSVYEVTHLNYTGTLISSERYWKRRASARWRNCLVDAHGNSWKQLYFERNLEDALEQFNVATSNVHNLRRLMTYSRRFAQNLKLRQLPSHLDLEILLDCMANSPSALTLCYGLQNVGMEYERALFGMKLCDCRSLARVLERTETLTYLDLSYNMLDDDKARMIASGLVDNLSLTHLDLSHNKIADRGIRAMAKVLDEKSVIAVLELCDNHIHSEGGRALARSLKKNLSLQSLGMRLNRLGDEGCRSICDALKNNTALTRLNLSANAAGQQTVQAISGVLQKNIYLRGLNLSCNSIGEAGGVTIRQALEENATLTSLDLRMSGIPQEEESAMTELMLQRAERKERQKLLKQL